MSEGRINDELAKAFSLAAGWTWHDVANDDPGARAREAARRIRESLRSADILLVDSEPVITADNKATADAYDDFVLYQILGDEAQRRALALEAAFPFVELIDKHAVTVANDLGMNPGEAYVIDTRHGADVWVRLADYIVEGR